MALHATAITTMHMDTSAEEGRGREAMGGLHEVRNRFQVPLDVAVAEIAGRLRQLLQTEEGSWLRDQDSNLEPIG
jgi:hypothetical protein